jgi:hypothetical protein
VLKRRSAQWFSHCRFCSVNEMNTLFWWETWYIHSSLSLSLYIHNTTMWVMSMQKVTQGKSTSLHVHVPRPRALHISEEKKMYLYISWIKTKESEREREKCQTPNRKTKLHKHSLCLFLSFALFFSFARSQIMCTMYLGLAWTNTQKSPYLHILE